MRPFHHPRPIIHSFLIILTLAAIAAAAVACSDESDALPAPPSPAPATALATQPAVAPTAPPMPTAIMPLPTPAPSPTAAPATPQPAIAPTAPPLPTAKPIIAASPLPAPTVGAQDAPQYGGTLNLVSRQNIRHQDVHQDVSAALSAWGPGIAYSRLMRYKSGADVTLPSLAVECEVCAEWTMVDPTTFEFRLREDALWQNIAPVNGRRLVADDIAFSYMRQREEGAPNAPLLRIIEAVDAPADDLLRVKIKAADADFLGALAYGHSKIVAREAVEVSGDLRDGPTIGSGAWTLVESRPDAAHIFERNAAYFERGAPYLDRLRIHLISDGDTAYAAFRVGSVDIHRLAPREWDDFQAQQPGASVLEYADSGRGLEVAFKTTRPPFDDVRVRRAAMLAMRPWRAIADIWAGAAHITQGTPLARVDWQLPENELRGYFGDPAKATRLLAETGAALPLPVTISVGSFDEPYMRHAERIADEMRAVGFAPQLDVVNRRRFGEEVWLGGQYAMFVGPTAPVASPNGYLLATLHSAGAWNTTSHSDARLDALIEAQAQEYDGDVRAELAREAQRMALEGGYRFMPAAAISLWAQWPRVKGFEPNFAGLEYSHWARVWIDE